MPCYCPQTLTPPNGTCPDCGRPTLKGKAHRTCNLSHIVCDTCKYAPYVPTNKYLEWLCCMLCKLPVLFVLVFTNGYTPTYRVREYRYRIIEYLMMMTDQNMQGEMYYNYSYNPSMEFSHWEFTPATWLREKWRQYKSKRVCGVDDNGDDLPF